MRGMTRLKILLADDHEVVRVGLKTIIERRESFQVIGEAAGAHEAVDKAIELKPDVVIMDIRMPDGSGIAACREIKQICPQIEVIMLTSFANDEAVFASIAAGAAGYVLKQIGSKGLIDALETVARGDALLDPHVTRSVLSRMQKLSAGEGFEGEINDSFKGLTEQERKILVLISEGKTNKQIACQIFLSEKTVRNYVSTILHKLGLSNRSQAAVFASQINMEN
jgi:two-component system, NarL family, response regulator DevR